MAVPALDQYCGSTFWNGSLLDREDPDLPLCFEQTVLVWTPLALLWLCAPWHLTALYRGENTHTWHLTALCRGENTHMSTLYLWKQMLVGVLMLTAVAGLALTLAEHYGPGRDERNPAVLYTNPILFAVSWNGSLLDREDPDLPLCFEQTVLVWTPLALLWLCAPWHLTALYRGENTHTWHLTALCRGENTHMSTLYLWKQMLVGVLMLTAVAGLALTLAEHYGPGRDERNPAVLYTNPILFAVSWNGSLLDREDPDLPLCFEQTVLVWTPLALLWLCAPWHLTALYRGENTHTWHLTALCRGENTHMSTLYLWKQMLVGVLMLTAVAGLALTLAEHYGPGRDERNPAVLYTNPILFAVSWLLLLLCQEGVRRTEGAVDSASLFLFWLLLLVCQVFPFQTLLREALRKGEVPDLPRFCLFYISFGLELVSLVLSALADVPPEAEDLVKKNPEAGATFLNRITFNWINSMVMKGYKRPLIQEHMWVLNKADSCLHITQSFQRVMEVELGAARVRLRKKLRKRSPEEDKLSAHAQAEQLQNGLAKGVSQDLLVMEEKGAKKDKMKKKKNQMKVDRDYPESWLIPTICHTFRRVLMESALFKLFQDLLAFLSPQLLKMMISFTKDTSLFAWNGYLYAVALLLVVSLQSLLLQQYYQRCFVLGTKIQTAIMATVYKKALMVSNDARKESTVGEAVNLMSADAQCFNNATTFIHLLWSCPLQIVLSIVFLWLELGPAVLAGLAVMVLMVPINGLLATKFGVFQVENMKYKDQRMMIMNEILNGIKILKLYAWERSFQSQVEGVREHELKVMKKIAYLSSISTFIFACAPALVILASFAVFVGVSSENVLDAEKAFTSISLFNILRSPLGMLPILITILVQVVVSKQRLEKFLGGDDLDMNMVRHDPGTNTAVSVCDGTFAWESDSEPILKSVSLDIKPGRLVAVVGAVGSGKSSLISSLLGEMHSVRGFVNLQGSVAYVPQQAWIQNSTLRDNILFGSPVEELRFQAVLEACALLPDLELLPGGDLTEIGEKGINLSGGQKQRVSLARAVYSQSDIYLLDDPLSAVDSHVGKHLFEKVLGPSGLLRDKTRILVTHGVSFLPHVDEIVVLVDGCVSEVGSYDSLRANRGAFSHFLDTYAKEGGDKSCATEPVVEMEEMDVEPEGQDPEASCVVEDVVSATLRRDSVRRSQRSGSVRLRRNSSIKKQMSPIEYQKGQRLIEEETMETGQVKFSIFVQYLRAIGWGYSTLVFLFYFMQSISSIGQSLWLSDWTNDAVDYLNMTYPSWKRDTRVAVFGALGIAQALLVFVGVLFFANGSISASRLLHSRLLANVLKAPMLFFDTTPLGRVVNRFAKDMLAVDEAIPQSFRTWLMSLLSVVGTLFIICLTTPIFTIVIIPLTVIYYFVQRFYVASLRQLRRLESVSRSPIYSHLGETVTGLSVIRAYGHQERFLKHNEAIMDENLKSVYPWIVSNRWLAIRLEFLGNLVVFFAALFAVVSRETLDSGMVGLSISYALDVTTTLIWFVRGTSDLETNFVSIERIREYTEIENEAAWMTDIRLKETWPEAGRLRFENYKVRYRPELDLVLHGITFNIDSTEKIGIVGRTGAGKSSLTNCLFRIIEAAEGRILIDGTDIATIGLHDLRNKLTIIPQDPVVFSGTLRMNLDPFETFSDEDIWRVLELSHLKEHVRGLQEGLHHEVSEGGENLSVGQKQLLCLARALLRKSRILILDEATAAVDLETDDLIQATIRREFSQCTVLTIAHRLHSILDSSRVMVLDAGRIVEFDTPGNLFEKQGHFYAMVKDAGITAL